MNLAALQLEGGRLRIDPLRDVNQTAAIVYDAKRDGGTSGVLILGGGSPKNFILQTEPQIQEVLGLAESGHDYFLQVTDARPDTGGLSGATASEAMTWGKVDPDKLPDSVTCYTDSTIALPLLTAYALARHAPRPLRRLYDRREAVYDALKSAYLERRAEGEADGIDGSGRADRHPPSHLAPASLLVSLKTRTITVDRDQPSPVAIDDGASVLRAGGWSPSRPRPSTASGPTRPTPRRSPGSSRRRGGRRQPADRPRRRPRHGSSCVASWPEEAGSWPSVLAGPVDPGPAAIGANPRHRDRRPGDGRRPRPRPTVARSLIARAGQAGRRPERQPLDGHLADPGRPRPEGPRRPDRPDPRQRPDLPRPRIDGRRPLARLARLLRPGPISREFLAEALGRPLVGPESAGPGGPLLSPGRWPSTMRLGRRPCGSIPASCESFPWPARSALIVVGRDWSREVSGRRHVRPPDPRVAAARLYAMLHHCDERAWTHRHRAAARPPRMVGDPRSPRASLGALRSWPASRDESSR